MKRLLLPLLLVVLPLGVIAQEAREAQRRSDRPADLIAADLGIGEQVFITCFAGVHPDAAHAPSAARQHANKAVLLPCLQAVNGDITNEVLDQVMDRYRPEGPMRGS